MTRRKSLFTQTDVAKVLRAAQSAGLKNVRVEIAKDGSIALAQEADKQEAAEPEIGIARNAADVFMARLARRK
jgi:hypothetical protein